MLDLIEQNFSVQIDDQEALYGSRTVGNRRSKTNDRLLRIFGFAHLDIEIKRRNINFARLLPQSLMNIITVGLVLQFKFRNNIGAPAPAVDPHHLAPPGIKIANLVNVGIGPGEQGKILLKPLPLATHEEDIIGRSGQFAQDG
ncbi:MAG: hypothetical protein A3G18_03485 [Rhodospirillales bacterium RIFCSPLOWO2_12_FULL_58_28]|nr:MAG: hypothetical protein A3G18_03485 [Rhodospirillales bacterium RIFCSPLOWO2_12_FULL_58_28]